LRHAREEVLGITQKTCASQIGIDRSTLANYEVARTPVRYEIALRFCRQFIISEEWLATGDCQSCLAVAKAKGIALADAPELLKQKIFIRQCMDLVSDPACLHIPTGTLFSLAYDSTLAARYRRLVELFWLLPMIKLTEADKPDLALNYLAAVNARLCILLSNEALRLGAQESDAWRLYTRLIIDVSQLIFRKMLSFQISQNSLERYRWLVEIATNPNAVIPFLSDTGDAKGQENIKNNLPKAESDAKDVGVKAHLPQLLERLKRATVASGSKSDLADFLGVPLASVSRWLSGDREPGGEYVLQMLTWVERQERKTK